MGTFVFFLIFLIFGACKKEKIQTPVEVIEKEIYGVYEIYPSYEKILIQFESQESCRIIVKDQIKNCIVKTHNKKLLIYTENLPIGIFLINQENTQYIKGLWKGETRFLRKIGY